MDCLVSQVETIFIDTLMFIFLSQLLTRVVKGYQGAPVTWYIAAFDDDDSGG